MPTNPYTKPKGLASGEVGRAQQKLALAPYPTRLEGDLWQFSRAPYMHGRYPRMLASATSREAPELKELRTNKQVQNFITENFATYNLEELLLSPVLPAEIASAIREQVATYDPSAPSEAILSLYEPAGYNIESTAMISDGDTFPNAPSFTRVDGPPIPAPCILKEISWFQGNFSWTSGGVGDEFHSSIYVEGFGSLFSANMNSGAQQNVKGTTASGLNRWILASALVPIIEIRVTGASTNPYCYVSSYLTIIAEPLIRKR